jgi:hypothetical protein
MSDGDGLLDYLTREQIEDLGGDPDELLRLGVGPVTGHDDSDCWPRWQIEEWLGRRR